MILFLSPPIRLGMGYRSWFIAPFAPHPPGQVVGFRASKELWIVSSYPSSLPSKLFAPRRNVYHQQCPQPASTLITYLLISSTAATLQLGSTRSHSFVLLFSPRLSYPSHYHHDRSLALSSSPDILLGPGLSRLVSYLV